MTKADVMRLRKLIAGVRASNPKTKARLDDLERELNRAKILDSKRIPREVITMNSRVRLIDLTSMEESIYTIVFPSDTNIEENRISVLAPVGTALLGYRVGDTIEWSVPSGVRRMKVLEVVYQPEASGHFDL